jgi:HK97 gp10 family phage protein
MTNKVTIKVEGLKELDEALREFSKATERNIIRRSLLAAGEPIRDAAAARAPRLRGALAASIGEGTKLSRRQKGLHRAESGVEVFVGAGSLAQAITQEFGTVNHPPQPFMRPAWDENKGRALSIFKDKMTDEIDKAAKRAARKALKAKK